MMYYYRMATSIERLVALERDVQFLKDEFKTRREELLALKENLLTIKEEMKFKSDKEIMRDYIDDVYRLKLSRFDDSSDDDSESDESDDVQRTPLTPKWK